MERRLKTVGKLKTFGKLVTLTSLTCPSIAASVSIMAGSGFIGDHRDCRPPIWPPGNREPVMSIDLQRIMAASEAVPAGAKRLSEETLVVGIDQQGAIDPLAALAALVRPWPKVIHGNADGGDLTAPRETLTDASAPQKQRSFPAYPRV